MTSKGLDYLVINGSYTKLENNYLMERDDFWKNTGWLNKMIQ